MGSKIQKSGNSLVSSFPNIGSHTVHDTCNVRKGTDSTFCHTSYQFNSFCTLLLKSPTKYTYSSLFKILLHTITVCYMFRSFVKQLQETHITLANVLIIQSSCDINSIHKKCVFNLDIQSCDIEPNLHSNIYLTLFNPTE